MEPGIRALWAVIVIGTLKALLETKAGHYDILARNPDDMFRAGHDEEAIDFLASFVTGFEFVNVLDMKRFITMWPSPFFRNHTVVVWSAAYSSYAQVCVRHIRISLVGESHFWIDSRRSKHINL